jgi:hypothetical protein
MIAPDIQTLRLAKLSILALPTLDPKAVSSVRKSSEEFARWRAALGTAMHELDIMSSGDPRWQAEAKKIVAAELRPIQTEVNRAVKRSSALSAIRVGTIDMGYTAVGAVAGAASGASVTSSLIGAVSGKGAEVVINYLRTLKRQREGKAILDLVVSFYPANDESLKSSVST